MSTRSTINVTHHYAYMHIKRVYACNNSNERIIMKITGVVARKPCAIPAVTRPSRRVPEDDLEVSTTQRVVSSAISLTVLVPTIPNVNDG